MKVRGRPFSADSIPAAARLWQSVTACRVAWPALNPAYEDPRLVEPADCQLHGREGLQAVVRGANRLHAFGDPRRNRPGGNVWVEMPAARVASEPIQAGSRERAERWAAGGLTSHYVVVPATDEQLVDAWFRSFRPSARFTLQPAPAAHFQPWTRPDIVRRAEPVDMPALIGADAILPPLGPSPIFRQCRSRRPKNSPRSS
jgi:hypothetical protein